MDIVSSPDTEGASKVLILPAAGEAFVTQLGLVMWLLEIGFRPTTIVCASSGAIVGGLCCASSFNAEFDTFRATILSKSRELSSRNYKRDKQYFASLFEGTVSMFNRGKDVPVEFFDFDFAKQPRLVISTYNRNTDKTVLWTTRPFGTLGVIKEADVCNVRSSQHLTDIIRAAISIPGIVPPIKIRDQYYVDDGNNNPSAFTYTRGLYTGKGTNTIFISHINIEDHIIGLSLLTDNPNISLLTQTLTYAPGYRFTRLRRSIAECISTVRGFAKSQNKNSINTYVNEYEGNDVCNLKIALENAQNSQISFILIMPKSTYTVSMLSFDKGDVSERARSVYTEGFKLKQWFVY